jgi:hypothetical protein
MHGTTFQFVSMSKYSHELLAPLVAESTSIAGVLRLLGLRPTGNSHAYISSRILRLGLDTSHFTGQGHLKGRPAPNRRSPESYLILRDPMSREPESAQLRKALVSVGRLLLCEDCGTGAVWNGKPITLQIHHKNGVDYDDREENLAFLCPNCHSQTENFASRNVKRAPKQRHQCPACGVGVSEKGLHCRKCCKRARYGESKTKIQWPSPEELRDMVAASSLVKVGKDLGVSDTAVRKRLKRAA